MIERWVRRVPYSWRRYFLWIIQALEPYLSIVFGRLHKLGTMIGERWGAVAVFTGVHLCSLVFTGVHWCSLVFIGGPFLHWCCCYVLTECSHALVTVVPYCSRLYIHSLMGMVVYLYTTTTTTYTTTTTTTTTITLTYTWFLYLF